MAATLTYSENGLRISGRIIAGDSASFRIAEGIEFAAGARLRWTLTDARPPDAMHTIAASDEIDPTISLDSKMSLRTPEIRQAFRGCRITEAIPAVLELIDTVHDAVYCSIRVQVANSRAVWLESDDFGNLSGLSAEDVRRALVGHTSRTDNPHGVTADQVGADAAGTAQVLIDAHDRDPEAHPDIHNSIANMDSVCRDYIAAHNTSEDSHADIREAVATAQSAAESASAAAQAVAGAINAHAGNKDNPHAVTEAQVAAASTDDADKAFGRLDSVNRWSQFQVVKPTTISDPISDESTIKSSNVVHLTAVDGGAPSCFLSGIGKSVPSGAIAEVMIVCENTTTEEQSFTIFFDYGRTISRLFRSDDPMPYNTFNGVPPNGLGFVNVLFWNKQDGDKITIVRDVWRSDWKDDGTNSTMAPRIFDGGGSAWKLLATGDGGMYTIQV